MIYRCTRSTPYSDNSPGYNNSSDRQGYYVIARDTDDALAQMAKSFPNESNFSIELWSFD